MAGAEKIREKILEEARLQAKNNIDNAEKEAQGIIRAAQEEAQQNTAKILDKAYIEANERKKRLIAVAELEGRKKKLEAKQQMIEEVFEKALDKLSNLPPDKYQDIIIDLIVNLVSTGDEELIFAEKDKKKLQKDFTEKVNQKLASKGIKGKITLSDESRNINSGFIIKKGDIEINNSFEALIRMQRDVLEADVVKALF